MIENDNSFLCTGETFHQLTQLWVRNDPNAAVQNISPDKELLQSLQTTNNTHQDPHQDHDGKNGGSHEKLVIPGAQARKHKAKTHLTENLLQSHSSTDKMAGGSA